MTPVDVMLYTKKGCCLCDEALAMLQELSHIWPLVITEVDITSDPALMQAFFDRIPVIELGGVRLEAPINSEAFKDAVAQAALALR